MLVVVQNVLAPYRVPLFNAVSRGLDDKFAVLLCRDTYPKRYRRWYVPRSDVDFRLEMLSTLGIEVGERVPELSFRIHRALDRLSPDAVVLGGWDLWASWSSLRWCRQHHIPAVAWVESGAASGSWRGSFTTLVRKRFLNACASALVSGEAAAAFVGQLRPGLPTTVVHNSVGHPALHTLPPPSAGGALFVGELSHRKGIDLLLEAAPQLLRYLEVVTIVGDGYLRTVVIDIARRYEGVHYLGYLQGEQLIKGFEGARVVIVPSRRDPAPLVASEALAAGRPLVLGSGVGNAADLRGLSPEAVDVMPTPSAAELVRSVRKVYGKIVDPTARSVFRPESSAAAFLRGTAIR